jgi:hypothetical protein
MFDFLSLSDYFTLLLAQPLLLYTSQRLQLSRVHSFPSLMQPKILHNLSFILKFNASLMAMSERVIYQCNRMLKYNTMSTV